MPYRLEFTVPGLPKMINSQPKNWRVRHRETLAWKNAVKLIINQNKPAKPLMSAALTLSRHSSIEPDFDGLVSGFKSTIDALVECGVLSNDRMSNIGQPKYAWIPAKKNAGKITVIVEENILDCLTHP